MLQVPGKQMRPKLIHGFNYWLKVPTDEGTEVKDIVQEFHNSSPLDTDIAAYFEENMD
ncbi:hypothetical protein Cfor_00488 [Coptotermes formosanus]|uniref:Uncharacterized protein n=1 Tax=Coptotermes formosanus TaxID=36987 RepID=A0A6L2Q3K8_COPFO|nr:hypothetical protein Cfor_00488 [Coptotermes formosanus]